MAHTGPAIKSDSPTRRDRRFRAREALRRFTTLPRVQACGAKSTLPERRVNIKVTDGAPAGYSGLQSCGSVWVCPWCSAKIATERARMLQLGVENWMNGGGQVGAMTLTVQHNQGDGLAELWDTVSGAFRSIQGGQAWLDMKAAYRIAGMVRVIEITHSWSNGWHVHIHAVIFFRGGMTDARAEDLEAWTFDRWRRALGRRCRKLDTCWSDCRGRDCGGYTAVHKSWNGEHVGAQIKLCTPKHAYEMGQYVAKSVYDPGTDPSHIALETARGDLKEARRGGLTPWQLLEVVIRDRSDRKHLAAWREYETASERRRQYGWTAGLKELLGIADLDRDDETIAADDSGGDVVASVSRETWKQLRAGIRSVVDKRSSEVPPMLGLLHAAEREGVAGLFNYALEHGIELGAPVQPAPRMSDRAEQITGHLTPEHFGRTATTRRVELYGRRLDPDKTRYLAVSREVTRTVRDLTGAPVPVTKESPVRGPAGQLSNRRSCGPEQIAGPDVLGVRRRRLTLV